MIWCMEEEKKRRKKKKDTRGWLCEMLEWNTWDRYLLAAG